MSRTRHHRRIALAAVAVAAVLSTAACTGSSGGGASDDPNAKTTITFWHGWSAPSEIKAIQDNVKAFEKAHPNITVKVVSNITDDKINQALRAGGPKAPDVVSSFTTDNVGEFCNSHAFVDLKPFLEKSNIDPTATFPGAAGLHAVRGQPVLTAAAQRRLRALLQQGDVREGGHQSPPKTLSEFDADAIKLTKSNGDSYSQLGFMPSYHGYESTITHMGAQFDPTYFSSDGKSTVADRPGSEGSFRVAEELRGQARRLPEAGEVPHHVR